MQTYIHAVRRLIAAGYPSIKAVNAVANAFGLTPDQLAALAAVVK